LIAYFIDSWRKWWDIFMLNQQILKHWKN
jgi:hypothetical protein